MSGGPTGGVAHCTMDETSAALDHAHRHALTWLSSLADRPVPPQASIEQVTKALGSTLPDQPTDAAEVVDLLADGVRARAHRDAVGAVLRLRDRRHASGRARGGLAGQRLGPELPGCAG